LLTLELRSHIQIFENFYQSFQLLLLPLRQTNFHSWCEPFKELEGWSLKCNSQNQINEVYLSCKEPIYRQWLSFLFLKFFILHLHAGKMIYKYLYSSLIQWMAVAGEIYFEKEKCENFFPNRLHFLIWTEGFFLWKKKSYGKKFWLTQSFHFIKWKNQAILNMIDWECFPVNQWLRQKIFSNSHEIF